MAEEKTIGEQIFRLRRKAGLTQKELGQKAGVSEGYLQRIESNEANPTVGILQALLRPLGLRLAMVEIEEG